MFGSATMPNGGFLILVVLVFLEFFISLSSFLVLVFLVLFSSVTHLFLISCGDQLFFAALVRVFACSNKLSD
jgi:hypothetical protein